MQPSPAEVFAGAAGSAVVSLAPKSVVGDICMTIMAASMGYMFAGMQLMMSMPRASEQIVQQQQLTPPQKTGDFGLFEAERQVPESAPNMPPNNTARPEAETRPSGLPESYTIVAGDSLCEIAARFYGDARYWPKIFKANPGLDPRRLRIGHVIKLPGPFPPP